MDQIAVRVGWVAITAARLETVVGLILVTVLGEEREAELLGRRWSDTYEDAKRTYSRMKPTQPRVVTMTTQPRVSASPTRSVERTC
jgi:hypothetical protein